MLLEYVIKIAETSFFEFFLFLYGPFINFYGRINRGREHYYAILAERSVHATPEGILFEGDALTEGVRYFLRRWSSKSISTLF